MKRNAHPGDLPIPRRTRLQPGEATIIYKLGKAAGEREAQELREQLAALADAAEAGTVAEQFDPDYRAWLAEAGIDADELAERASIHPAEEEVFRDLVDAYGVDAISDLDGGPDPAPPCRIPDLDADRSRTVRAAIRPCRPSGRRGRAR